MLPSSYPIWATPFSGDGDEGNDPDRNDSGMDRRRVDSGGEECKKKKKRAKKKRSSSPNSRTAEAERKKVKDKQEFVCSYPFTSSSSATQRKIKQQYDHLLKFHESNGLTLAQVSQFDIILIEARNDLQHNLAKIDQAPYPKAKEQ